MLLTASFALLAAPTARAQRLQIGANADRKPVETLELKFKNEFGGEEETTAEVWARQGQNLLVLTPDGQLRTVLKEEQISVEQTQKKMQPLTQQEIFDELKSKLPPAWERVGSLAN